MTQSFVIHIYFGPQLTHFMITDGTFIPEN